MTKKEIEQRAEETKDWCEDMMEKYLKYWSADDEIYKNLKQFYDENRITGIIDSNTSQADIEKWFEGTAKKINKMYRKITFN